MGDWGDADDAAAAAAAAAVTASLAENAAAAVAVVSAAEAGFAAVVDSSGIGRAGCQRMVTWEPAGPRMAFWTLAELAELHLPPPCPPSCSSS